MPGAAMRLGCHTPAPRRHTGALRGDVQRRPQATLAATLATAGSGHAGSSHHSHNHPEAAEVPFSSTPGVICGLISGVVTTAVFNPYDRALFLSIRDRRPFLRLENFRSPYQGFLQSVGIRAFSSGMWYPMEHFFCERFPGHLSFLAGSAAGVCSSAILNPLTAIKYQTWYVPGHAVERAR